MTFGSTNAVADDIYGEDYFRENKYIPANFFDEYFNNYDRIRFTAELDLLEGLALKGKILDIGCATGNFLHYAKERGWLVFGHDVSEFAAHCTRERVGATVVTGPLDTGAFPHEFFDVITLHHVLEHVADPYDFLSKEVFPLVRAGGLVFIEVPNFASLEARVLKDEWEDLRPEQHLWHFTPESMEILIERVGGSSVRLFTAGPPLWRRRMLMDYLWMLVTASLGLPYRGVVGRDVKKMGEGRLFDRTGSATDNRHSMIYKFIKLLGVPLMEAINRKNVGKRLVMIVRKEG